jgi:hypothetical protein
MLYFQLKLRDLFQAPKTVALITLIMRCDHLIKKKKFLKKKKRMLKQIFLELNNNDL